VGFAVETGDGAANATAKLREKRLDVIVLNSPSSFGGDRIDATIFRAGGASESFRGVLKGTLAHILVDITRRKL